MKLIIQYILLISFIFISGFANAHSSLVLAIGGSEKLKVPSGSNIRVSNSKVIRVQDQGIYLLLSGRKVGQAVISHAQGTIRVDVVSVKVAKTYRQFQAAIADMQGLELGIEDDHVIVSGELLRLSDWQKLSELHKLNGGAWRWQAKIENSIQPRVRTYLLGLLQSWLATGTYRLQMQPYPQIEAAKITTQQIEHNTHLQNLGLVLINDQGFADLQPAIRLKLTLAEVQNGASERLGLRMEDGQNLQLLPRFKAPTEFAAALGFLTEKGLAKLLATPSLTARSGHTAEFLAGGEFAVKTSNYRVKDVSWKRHGLWLKFKPTLDPRGIVQLEVDTEFSSADYSNVIDGIPSLRTSKASSAVDMRLGSTVLLSGMVRMSQGFTASGPQGLSDLPILGRLFRSEDFSAQRSQLLIFVTPELVPIESDEEIVLPNEGSPWKTTD